MSKATTPKPAAKPAAAKRAAKDKDPQMLDGIFVRSLPERFRRAGFDFSREGYGLILADLTPEQLKAIEEEPMLSVQYVEIPATAADDAALADLVADEENGGAKGGANTPPSTTETPPAV